MPIEQFSLALPVLTVSAEEEAFAAQLYLGVPKEVKRCRHCGKPFKSITFHVRTCEFFWQEKEEPNAQRMAVPHESSVLPSVSGAEAQAARAVGDVSTGELPAPLLSVSSPAHPGVPVVLVEESRPTEDRLTGAHEPTITCDGNTVEPVALVAPAAKPIPVCVEPVRWYRWVRKDPMSKRMVSDTTLTLSQKRVSLPEIASHLWYAIKSLSGVYFAMPDDLDPESDFLWVRLEHNRKRYLALLVECGIEEETALTWGREAWKRAKEQYNPWFEWPTEAKDLLARLGYDLSPGESIGWEPPKQFNVTTVRAVTVISNSIVAGTFTPNLSTGLLVPVPLVPEVLCAKE